MRLLSIPCQRLFGPWLAFIAACLEVIRRHGHTFAHDFEHDLEMRPTGNVSKGGRQRSCGRPNSKVMAQVSAMRDDHIGTELDSESSESGRQKQTLNLSITSDSNRSVSLQ